MFEKMESYDVEAVCNKIINRRLDPNFQKSLSMEVKLPEIKFFDNTETLKVPKSEDVKNEPTDFSMENALAKAECVRKVVLQEPCDQKKLLHQNKAEFLEFFSRVEKISLSTEKPKIGFKEFDNLMSNIHHSMIKLHESLKVQSEILQALKTFAIDNEK